MNCKTDKTCIKELLNDKIFCENVHCTFRAYLKRAARISGNLTKKFDIDRDFIFLFHGYEFIVRRDCASAISAISGEKIIGNEKWISRKCFKIFDF